MILRCAVLLLFAGCASSSQLGRDVDRLFSRYESYGFTGSVLVAQGPNVLLERGYGRGITPRTTFDVGSIMKTVVAAAVLQLEERGSLSTSDRVSRYIGELPPDREAMTIAQLLLHTSGLPLDVPRGSDDLIALARSVPLVGAPGEKYSYSNFGYGLLALVVERVAQQPFREYARANLPLGDARFWGEAEPTAIPYSGNSDEELEPAEPLRPNAPGSPMWGKYVFGAGGLIAAPRDLLRWWRAIESNEAMFAERIEGQAFGWNVRRLPDGTLRHYRGGLVRASFTSMLSAYRGRDVVLIWMMNKHTGGRTR